MSKKSKQYNIFQFFNVIILLIIVAFTLYPFIYVVAQSFSAEKYIVAGQVNLFPKGFNINTYKVIMGEKYFWIGYKNTIIYTVSATIISLLMSTMFAYPLSKKRLIWKKPLLLFAVFTMFFDGGLIPNYLLIRNLGMRNTIWSIIVPGAISTYNMIIMRSFFEGIPDELEEAASVDGSSTFRTLFTIILPLSMPIIASMTLFYAVGNWNSWFGPFLYFDNKDQFPIALYLRNIIAGAQQSSVSSGSDTDALTQIGATIKSATIVLTVLPILCIYPFIQKYFVTGVMIGSVKG